MSDDINDIHIDLSNLDEFSDNEQNSEQTLLNNDQIDLESGFSNNSVIFYNQRQYTNQNDMLNDIFSGFLSNFREVRNSLTNYTLLDSENPISIRIPSPEPQFNNIYNVLLDEKKPKKVKNSLIFKSLYTSYFNLLRRTNNLLNKNIEEIYCTSCYCDFNDKIILLKKINDIDVLKSNTLFASPCGEHFICYECLKSIALSFDNHMINRNNSLISCLVSSCLTSSSFPFYFNHSQIKKVLTNKEFKRYIEYAETYEFPGFEIVRCPNILHNHDGAYKCNTKNIVPVEKIKQTPKGCLIIHCVQNIKCYYSFCYNCKQKIYSTQKRCDICFDNNEYNNPFGINRFLVKTQNINNEDLEVIPEMNLEQDEKTIRRTILEETDYLYRNNEITVNLGLEYINTIINSDKEISRFQIQCPCCLNFFYKTEKCSALKHCGIERCYSCGKIQERNERDLNDHWSAEGINGCPRFDCESYWNKTAKCNFLCRDEFCYSHEIGECKIEEHQEGIQNMIKERKKAFIYHFLKSLLKETRNEILSLLDEDIYEGLSKNFLEKIFKFLEKNPSYVRYYSPLVFLDELDEFY